MLFVRYYSRLDIKFNLKFHKHAIESVMVQSKPSNWMRVFHDLKRTNNTVISVKMHRFVKCPSRLLDGRLAEYKISQSTATAGCFTDGFPVSMSRI